MYNLPSQARNVITDNWLLQNAAELLAGDKDPAVQTSFFAFDNEAASVLSVRQGAIGFLCLASLIEQLVFCDHIFVMRAFTDHFSGISPQLDALLDDVIRGLERLPSPRGIQRPEQDSPNKSSQAEFFPTPEYLKEHQERWEIVVQGAAEYLELSEAADCLYCPHPARAAYLQSSHLYLSQPGLALKKLTSMVDGSRVRLAEAIYGDSRFIELGCRISSVALYCLQNSSPNCNVLQTALQVRVEKEFVSLRKILLAMEEALSRNAIKEYRGHCKAIEKAIRDVERRLGIRHLDERDGFSQLTIFSFPIKVAASLRGPLLTPRHSSVIHKLVSTGAYDLAGLMKNNFGFTDNRILADVLTLT